MAKDKTDKTDATLVQLNEWGIPDWRDKAAYGDTKQWTFNRWRWEFYRRRDDLRDYFEAQAEATFRHWQPHVGKSGFSIAHLRPNEPGFRAIADTEARARFGYSGIPNPRIGDQHASAIRPWLNDGTVRTWEAMSGRNGFRGTLGDLLDFCGVTLTDEQRTLLAHAREGVPVNLDRDEIAIGFDLNRPLQPQIDMALDVLRHAFRERGKPLQRRRHPAKWLGYLRTLDAHEAGASWAQIAQIHPATAGTEQTARDIWEAANALRFNF